MNMLRKRTSLARTAIVVALLFICGWVWISAPMESGDNTMLEPNPYRVAISVAEDKDTRQNTPKLAPPASRQSHHHNNETLENMRKNMTLLNVNMSGVESIMNKVNASKMIDNGAVKSNGRNGVKYANPHPFHYVINAKKVCTGLDLFLIIYIHTAPSHYKRRMIIRQTWGNPKYYSAVVRLVFVMGKTDDKPEVQQALEFEAEQYGDLVQEDFADTYKNLTYKGIASLKWITYHCSNAKFVLKTDDDIFVNMFTYLKHLSSLDRLGVDNKGLLMCLVWYKMKVMREGKWKISEEQWKESVYPTYCSGSAYTMSIDVAIAMHNVSYHVPFFWVDDFYITGLLPLKLGNIKHKQFMSTYVLDGRRLEEKFTGPQWFTYIFSHVHDLNAIQSVWHRLLLLTNGEATPTVKYALPGQLPKEDKKPNNG